MIAAGNGYTEMSCKVITVQYRDDTSVRGQRS